MRVEGFLISQPSTLISHRLLLILKKAFETQSNRATEQKQRKIRVKT
jgi:hypothetical protein